MRPAEVEVAREVDFQAVGGFFRQCLNCLRREERFEKLVAREQPNTKSGRGVQHES